MNGDDDALLAALARIAGALERLAPAQAAPVDPLRHRQLAWDGARLAAVEATPALPLDRFVAVDAQRDALVANLHALAAGRGGHDMLLWGARGMGKSALLRSAAHAVGGPLRLVEVAAPDLPTLPALFRLLPRDGAWLLYIDDLVLDSGGDPGSSSGAGAGRRLRSLLDGGIHARPLNARLAVTSNHRHLLARKATDVAEVRQARDEQNDQLALADRFGLTLGFHAAGQEDYLEMVRRHAAAAGLAWEARDALAFAAARGGRSGRTAWHYVVDLRAR